MKKITVTLGVFLIISTLLLLQKLGLSNLLDKKNINIPSTNSFQPENSNTIQVTLTPTITLNSEFKYKDGHYTGKITDAFYGDFQVKAIIENGRITDIEFLVFPNDRSTSIQINEQAMPLFKREAIKNQNAEVDIVSGATQSSVAFKESLQSALDQAL